MKAWWFSMVLAASACAPSRQAPEPVTPASAPGQALARFTVEGDPATGAFRVITHGTGAADRSTALAIPEGTGVLVERAAPSWYDPSGALSIDHGCGMNGPTAKPSWGGFVDLVNQYASPVYLSGVFARISSAFPAATITSCTASPAPANWDLGNGAWAFGYVPATSAVSTWAFDWVSATQFTFTGEVFGAKVTPRTSPPPVPLKGQARADGDVVVYPYESGLGIMTADGSISTSAALPGFPGAVAPDRNHGRIWYVGWRGYAGYTDANGQNPVTGPLPGYIEAVVNPSPPPDWFENDVGYGVALDPTDTASAWLLTSSEGLADPASGLGANQGAIRKISVGSPAAPVMTDPTRFAGNPGGIAAVAIPDTTFTTLYVTNTTANRVDVWDTRSMTSTPVAKAGCEGPGPLVLGPDGALWIAASTAICRLTTAGVMSVVAAAPTPTGICVGPSNSVWYVTTAGIVRIYAGDAVDPNPWDIRFAVPLNENPATCTYSAAVGFWVAEAFGGNDGLFRFDLFAP